MHALLSMMLTLNYIVWVNLTWCSCYNLIFALHQTKLSEFFLSKTTFDETYLSMSGIEQGSWKFNYLSA